jgi:hypothetical protein
MTPSGIEPATFRFVAQYLNHCATISGPQLISIHVEQPDDGQHQWPKHVVAIYSMLLNTQHTPINLAVFDVQTYTYYIYCSFSRG